MLDKKTGLLYLKKRSITEVLIFLIFLFPFIMAFLLEFLKLPTLVKYSVDLMYVCAFLSVVISKQAALKKNITPFAVFFIVFLLYTLIIYLFNFQSPFYYLWGIRNNFRFYTAFFLFAVVFEEEDALGCLKLMDFAFWINAAVSVYQFFILDLRQDYLGGIFGVEKGCNAFSILFFSIVIGKSMIQFMNKEEKTWLCFVKCAVSLLIAAMAELKVYFIIFILILVASAIMTRFSFRKVILIAAASVFVMFSGMLLPLVFGDSKALTLETFLETITATNYATQKDLGRFTAIPTISRDFLTSRLSQLFGMGLGNCDTSSFDICNSEFYQSHSYLNYNWFSSAFLFLETGYIGLIAYLSFFVICFICAVRQLKKGANELFCRISMIISIICIIMVFYNSSLRTETAYMVFFALALPFVDASQMADNPKNKEVIAWQ